MPETSSVDTSVFLRLFVSQPEDHARRVKSLVERMLQSGDKLYVPVTVISETCFYLNRRLGVERQKVAVSILDLMGVDAFVFENDDAVHGALTFWRDHGGVSFLDCYHLAHSKALGIQTIYAFDRGMDRYPGVERIEP